MKTPGSARVNKTKAKAKTNSTIKAYRRKRRDKGNIKSYVIKKSKSKIVQLFK